MRNEIYLFEVTAVESHVAVEGRYVFEFSMAQIALHRFRLGLGLGSRDRAGRRRISGGRAALPHISASRRADLLLLLLLLLLRLLLRLLLLLLRTKPIRVSVKRN